MDEITKRAIIDILAAVKNEALALVAECPLHSVVVFATDLAPMRSNGRAIAVTGTHIFTSALYADTDYLARRLTEQSTKREGAPILVAMRVKDWAPRRAAKIDAMIAGLTEVTSALDSVGG